jgi:hypothetical protein
MQLTLVLLASQSKDHEIDVAYANWLVMGNSPCFCWHLNPKTLDMMWLIFCLVRFVEGLSKNLLFVGISIERP